MCVFLVEVVGGELWGRGGLVLERGRVFLGSEEGVLNKFVLWELILIMVYSVNLGVC